MFWSMTGDGAQGVAISYGPGSMALITSLWIREALGVQIWTGKCFYDKCPSFIPHLEGREGA